MAAGDFARAHGAYRDLLDVCRPPAGAIADFAEFASQMGQHAVAEQELTRAIRQAPDDPALRMRRGFARLRAGDWASGWADYEARLEVHSLLPFETLRTRSRRVDLPRWLPGDPRPRSLLVFTEQGLGDTLQFARFLAPLAEAGVGLSVVGEERLRPIFEAFGHGVGFQAVGGPLFSDADRWCSLLSLPALLGLASEADLRSDPYLRLDAPPRVRGSDALRVGVVWQGNRRHPDDARRSIGLHELAGALHVPGVRLVSLQVGDGAEQAAAMAAELPMDRPLDGASGGFGPTLAVLNDLDLVVSVDTGPAHLAGAVGKPVLLLLAARADWRWMTGRTDTAWYPRHTLVRQERPGRWDAPLARLHELLSAAAV